MFKYKYFTRDNVIYTEELYNDIYNRHLINYKNLHEKEIKIFNKLDNWYYDFKEEYANEYFPIIEDSKVIDTYILSYNLLCNFNRTEKQDKMLSKLIEWWTRINKV